MLNIDYDHAVANFTVQVTDDMRTRLCGRYWLESVNFVHEPYMKRFYFVNLKLVTAGLRRQN